MGTYNPDWAVLVEKDGAERLYFVVETKSSLFTDDLRDKESAKINCGKAHFKALAVGENPAEFIKATEHRRPDGEGCMRLGCFFDYLMDNNRFESWQVLQHISGQLLGTLGAGLRIRSHTVQPIFPAPWRSASSP